MKQYNLHRVQLNAVARNLTARKVGSFMEGTLPFFTIMINGHFHDK